MYQASETKTEGRVIPLLNPAQDKTHLLSKPEDSEKDALQKRRNIIAITALSIFCIWMFFSLKVNLLDNIEEEGCFTWEGQYYCPGDCIVQDLSEPAEYCPAEGEEPSLVYNYTVNTEAKCKDGSTPVFHYRRASPGGENK